MNSRERVLATVGHQAPDRLPITFDAEPEVIARLSRHFGVTTRDEVWNALHADTRLIGVNHHYRHIREEGGIRYDFWGIGSKEQAYSGGTYWEYCHHPLKELRTLAEIEAYDWPTPDEASFEALRTARRNNPDKAIIAHITHGGYFKATHLRGMEQVMLDLAMDPEISHAVISRVVDGYILPVLERLCREAGDAFDIFYMADDICSARGPLFSQDMFEEFVKPYMTRIARVVHAHDKKFLLHVCGSVRPFLPGLIEAGVDILEPIQTSAVGMEPEGLKRDFGDRICFYGSVDLIEVLSRGTPETVRAEVLRLFRTLGKGGGLIIGPGHTYIQPDVPLENILAMYETAFRECGYTS